MAARRQDSAPVQACNAATRTVVSTLGVLLGISSMSHGLFEMMQGNIPTPGFLVKALGPGHSWTLWANGSEPAFTLLHNFLLTGMLATAMGILQVIWSLGFIQRRGGPSIFLLISVASFLVGGGLAQVLPFTLTWAAGTRIHATLAFWQWLLPAQLRRILARVWLPALIAAAVLFLAALEIAAIGYFPGLPRDTPALNRILWRMAGMIVAAVPLAIIAGFARDLEARAMDARSRPHDSQPLTVHHD